VDKFYGAPLWRLRSSLDGRSYDSYSPWDVALQECDVRGTREGQVYYRYKEEHRKWPWKYKSDGPWPKDRSWHEVPCQAEPHYNPPPASRQTLDSGWVLGELEEQREIVEWKPVKREPPPVVHPRDEFIEESKRLWAEMVAGSEKLQALDELDLKEIHTAWAEVRVEEWNSKL